MADWIDACAADDIEEEDVIRFDHGARTFIIVRDHEDNYYCTDGLCTHEDVHLCDGLGGRADDRMPQAFLDLRLCLRRGGNAARLR